MDYAVEDVVTKNELKPINDRLLQIETDIIAIHTKLSQILDTMGRTEEVVKTVAAEVMPTVEKLTKNPMLKMLL